MPIYKSSVSIEAPVEVVFAYVSDVRHLASYVEGMVEAEPLGAERVRVTAEVDGQRRVGEAWFRVKPGRRRPRIEWGSAGPHDYHGWLEVDREGEVASVTVELHTGRVSDDRIDEALDRTLFALRDRVEGPAGDRP